MDRHLLLIIVLVLAGFVVSRSQTPSSNSKVQTEAEQIIERMRGHSMLLPAAPRSDLRIDPTEQRRRAITKELRRLGGPAVTALARALKDVEVQMRQNAALMLINVGGGYSIEAQPKLDIRAAMPVLIKATEDVDPNVRAWAAHALAEIGPDAKVALPALLKLLKDREEGPRNTGCMALGRIGPAAKSALPALREALNDPSKDVRRFAQQAI